jgi:hypothetical protein
VHPWDVELARDRPDGDARNVLAGTVGATTLDGGRTRVRVGDLVAEADASTALPRGALAYAVFGPSAVRLIPLDGRSPAGDGV